MTIRLHVVAPLVAALGLAACETPIRYSLPTPFPVIMGATPISREGFAFGAELADGVRGQELQRTETRGAFITGGIMNRISGTVSGLRTPENGTSSGSVRIQARVARPFGSRSALGIHVGASGSQRLSGSAQDENVAAFEVALPLEVLATKPDAKVWLSGFVAPRLVGEKYTDKLDAASNLSATFPAATSGIHLRAWFLDLFAETTVVAIPQNTYKGVQTPARTIAIAALALALRIGQPYDWLGK